MLTKAEIIFKKNKKEIKKGDRKNLQQGGWGKEKRAKPPKITKLFPKIYSGYHKKRLKTVCQKLLIEILNENRYEFFDENFDFRGGFTDLELIEKHIEENPEKFCQFLFWLKNSDTYFLLITRINYEIGNIEKAVESIFAYQDPNFENPIKIY
jgi:hypothetical protein